MQLRPLFRPDFAIGLFCALALVVVTEFHWLGDYGPSGQVEVAAVVLYAASVWLAAKNSIWTWPTGIAATALYLYLFYDWRLYADAGLQLVYIGFGLAGYWAWWRRGQEGLEAPARVSAATMTALLVAVAAGTVAVREYLIEAGGAAPFWDAFLTAGSLGATYLLIRRYIETWLMWAVLDVAYVALFLSRELYLTAVLYGVLLAMVVKAAREWRELLPAPRSIGGRA